MAFGRKIGLWVAAATLLCALACTDNKPGADSGEETPDNNGVENNGGVNNGVEGPCTEPCNDGNPCTIDTCDSLNGCQFRPDDTACDDGIECTADSCDSLRGCVHEAMDTLCEDSHECTTNRCDLTAGCVATPDPTQCNDGIGCTVDRCDLENGCVHEGNTAACDDGISCTVDSCDPAEGCVHQANHAQCDDGVACTLDECDPIGGCSNVTNDELCDDGNSCTTNTCDRDSAQCIAGDRDEDGDGFTDWQCGGNDCSDENFFANPDATEICNHIDDNCDGNIDEGVQSPCGDCNDSCFAVHYGGDDPWNEEDMFGTAFDEDRGGIIADSVNRRFNFLWIPNTGESTVSKWDANTATELARYKVGLPAGECIGQCCWSSNCNQPSRVGVDGRGDAYVANRGFGMQGTVTKMWADLDDCVDRNNNGVIDTSTDATPMAYDTDECVAYTVPVGQPNAVLRALAIDLGNDERPEGYVWVGGYSARTWWKLDPRTGEEITSVTVPVSPYGGVVTADGKLWTGVLSGNSFVYVDTATNTVGPSIAFPNFRGRSGSYGITADGLGRVWIAGWGGRDAFGYDPELQQWTVVDSAGFGGTVGRGITVDGQNRIWAPVEANPTRMAVFDSEDFVPGGVIPAEEVRTYTPPGSRTGASGIGADANGKIWLAHYNAPSELVRLDPVTEEFDVFTGPNRVYTYSDFTGQVRRTIVGEGIYQVEAEAACDTPDWDLMHFDAETPEGSSITFTGTSAPSHDELDLAQPLQLAEVPGDASPVAVGPLFDAAQIPQRKFLRISIFLEVNDNGISPVLRDFRMTWFCKN